jgi:DNA-binding transcriptional LysR family regulator
VHREELRVAVPTGHQLTGLDRPVTGADLAGQPLIMPSAVDARYFHELVQRTVSIDPAAVVHAVSQVLTTALLVAAGLGIGFVPASIDRLGIDGVTLLPLATTPQRPVELHLVWSRENRNPTLPRALDLLAAEAPTTLDQTG